MHSVRLFDDRATALISWAISYWSSDFDQLDEF